MAEFTPKRLAEYDGNDAVLYFPETEVVATVRECECDDECDYENGFTSLIVGHYYLTDSDGIRWGDGDFFGYHNMREWVADEFGDEECWVISDEGIDSGLLDDLVAQLDEYADLDLYEQVRKVRAIR